jgi:D-alanyl-D-alanine carboxypeptidase (penicillin-binding protein 5/6)
MRAAGSLLLVLALAAAPAGAQTYQAQVGQAILVDAGSGAILYEKDADKPVPPASLAKLMTAELVFRALAEGRIKLDDTFQISENAWRNGGASAGGSTMFAVVKSSVRVEDLLRGLIIQSGNDAAIALAEGLAGSETVFAKSMSDRARELGLARSTFRNASGRGDPEQLTTMREMEKLAAHIIATYPQFYPIFGEKQFTWNKITQLNRNPLLTMDIGADGLKTGNIDESGFGLVGSAVQNGQRLIVALNGAKTARDRAEEGRKLLLWGFRSFEPRHLFDAGETVGAANVYGGEKASVPLVSGKEILVLSPRGGGERMSAEIVYAAPLRPPVARGQTVARLKVYRGSTLALDAPLQAAEDVEQGSLTRRATDAAWELATGWVGGLLGKAKP